MRQGIQTLLESAGNYACYFLCVLELAERIKKTMFNVETIFENAVQQGFVYVNMNDFRDKENFFMSNPAGMLSFLTKKKYRATIENRDYKPKPGELVVELWKYEGRQHFRLPDWDSVQDSVIVSKGRLEGYRIFREVV